ncbi:unnamed protein product [Peniophora sp. CBMAI 1063]|nr:unnamed protein product [Peniophora sp. CBMAI 1063]
MTPFQLSVFISMALGLTAQAAPLTSSAGPAAPAPELEEAAGTATTLLSGLSSSGSAVGMGTHVDTSGSVFRAPSSRRTYDYSETYGRSEDPQDEYTAIHFESYPDENGLKAKRAEEYAYGYNKSAYGCDTEDGYGLDGWDQEDDEHCKHIPHRSHEKRDEVEVKRLVKRHGFEPEGEDEEDDEDKWDDDGFGYVYAPDSEGVYRRLRIG